MSVSKSGAGFWEEMLTKHFWAQRSQHFVTIFETLDDKLHFFLHQIQEKE